jgi:tetratricopeptide (TPR) repeat protein
METAEIQSLRHEIERSLRGAFDPTDVVPRLVRLARFAPPASDHGIFANHKLGELVAERDPWRGALYVRRALAHRPGDDRSWAVLAFCQTLLGNYRCARAAYERAIRCAPGNPWYAHNLGHLLDVALGEPGRALPWLEAAYVAKRDNSEIVTSYVHALARAGKPELARAILDEARARGTRGTGDRLVSRELDALRRWLDQGAPSRRRAGPPAPPSGATPRRLARVLARGLSHLPLDPRQRERALALARDALPPVKRLPRSRAASALARPVANGNANVNGGEEAARGGAGPEDVAGLAAAVAYAIVYIDHVPLSQAEVAAPFRVGVAHLRGRFAELRAKLDIIRGDARYASARVAPPRTRR